VFPALSRGDFASIDDSKLYLPETWTSSKTRLDQAQVPVKHHEFKTKQELALKIINHQIALNMLLLYFIFRE
jgi:SRSO17 transposase